MPARDDARFEIGARIRKRREALDLSQQAVGDRMATRSGRSVSRAQVSRWENGKDMPERARWTELADALETTPAAIFGAADLEEALAGRVELLEFKLSALADLVGVSGVDLEAAMRARRQRDRRLRRAANREEAAASAVEDALDPSAPRRRQQEA